MVAAILRQFRPPPGGSHHEEHLYGGDSRKLVEFGSEEDNRGGGGGGAARWAVGVPSSSRFSFSTRAVVPATHLLLRQRRRDLSKTLLSEHINVGRTSLKCYSLQRSKNKSSEKSRAGLIPHSTDDTIVRDGDHPCIPIVSPICRRCPPRRCRRPHPVISVAVLLCVAMCIDVPVAGTGLLQAEQVIIHAASSGGKKSTWRPAVVVGPSALGPDFVQVMLHSKSRRLVDVRHALVDKQSRTFESGDLVRRTCINFAEEDAKARCRDGGGALCPIRTTRGR